MFYRNQSCYKELPIAVLKDRAFSLHKVFMSIYILPFIKLNKKSVGLAGGKGTSLGEMTHLRLGSGGQAQANVVPPGFVVLASAFDRFFGRDGFECGSLIIVEKGK